MSKRLRKSDIRELNDILPIDIDKKDDIQLIDEHILLVNNLFFFFMYEGKWVPSVRLLLEKPALLPCLVVDMGAVRFVANGADIMRPGICEIPEGDAGTIVAIVDENNRRPFAVGQLKHTSSEMRAMSSGSVVNNLHFVGDDMWKIYVTRE